MTNPLETLRERWLQLADDIIRSFSDPINRMVRAIEELEEEMTWINARARFDERLDPYFRDIRVLEGDAGLETYFDGGTSTRLPPDHLQHLSAEELQLLAPYAGERGFWPDMIHWDCRYCGRAHSVEDFNCRGCGAPRVPANLVAIWL